MRRRGPPGEPVPSSDMSRHVGGMNPTHQLAGTGTLWRAIVFGQDQPRCRIVQRRSHGLRRSTLVVKLWRNDSPPLTAGRDISPGEPWTEEAEMEPIRVVRGGKIAVGPPHRWTLRPSCTTSGDATFGRAARGFFSWLAREKE